MTISESHKNLRTRVWLTLFAQRHGTRSALRTLTFERWTAGYGTPLHVAGETWRWAIWPLFLLGFAVLSAGLLIGPRVPSKDAGAACVGNIELSGPFGFSLNCDSPEFMWLARDPAGLLYHHNSRQSRPGLILAAALLQVPLSLIAPADGPPTPVYQGLYDPVAVARSFTRDRPAYIAYVLLNIAILLASFHVLRKITERPRPARNGTAATIVVATGLLLVANDVTKAFVWSPHTQMFNILVPLIAVYATLRSAAGAFSERSFALALGTLVGFGMTAYPVVAVVAACAVPPAIVLLAREKFAPVRWRGIVNIALFVALAAIPSALWYGFVELTTGHFFSAELDLRQVIWMKDELGKGLDVFLVQWFDYLGQLISFAAPQAIALVAFVVWLALTVFIQVARRGRQLASLSPALPGIAAGLYVSAAVLGFYTCVGWATDRLAYPMIPPLVAAAGAAALVIAQRLPPRRRPVFAAGCLAIAIAQIIYVVVKDGPFS
jgi:hypothetical protein